MLSLPTNTLIHIVVGLGTRAILIYVAPKWGMAQLMGKQYFLHLGDQTLTCFME